MEKFYQILSLIVLACQNNSPVPPISFNEEIYPSNLQFYLCQFLLNPDIGINALIHNKLTKYFSPILTQHANSGALRHMIPLIKSPNADLETKVALAFFPSSPELNSALQSLNFNSNQIDKIIYLHKYIDLYYDEYQNKNIFYLVKLMEKDPIDNFQQFLIFADLLDCDFVEKYNKMMKLKVCQKDFQICGISQKEKIDHAIKLAQERIDQFPELNNRLYLLEFCFKILNS